MLAAGISPVVGIEAGALAAKTFCITGSQSRSRKELVALIEDNGGRVVSGVSKKLDYLLIADIESTSSKAVKARRYGTTLISEQELAELLGPQPAD